MTRFAKSALALFTAFIAMPALAQDLPQANVTSAAVNTAQKVRDPGSHYLITADGAIIGMVTGVAATPEGESLLQVDMVFGIPNTDQGIATVLAEEARVVNGQYLVSIASPDLVLSLD